MAISPTTFILVLATLAINFTWTVQTYQEAVEVLNSIPFDEMEGQGQDEEGGDPFTDLWSDIEDAFRFLAERQMEDELRRLKMLEISKRFPIRRHNFVRFGKRYQPTHNFVRFGRSLPEDDDSSKNGAAAVAKRGAYLFSGGVLGDPSSFYPVFSLASRESEGDRGGVLLRITRAAEEGDLETSGDVLRKRNLNRFVRIGRSVRGSEKPVSQVTELPESSLLAMLRKRQYDTARIGRVPAALFFNRPNAEQTSSQGSKTGGAGYNEFARYG